MEGLPGRSRELSALTDAFSAACAGRAGAVLVGGDYQGDAAFRERFQAWMSALWEEKDATIGRIASGAGPAV